MANVGLTYDGFCDLTPEEFSCIYRAYSEEREAQYRDRWERMRVLAAICVSPYSKKGTSPHKLLPLPWDGERTKATKDAPKVTKEDALKQFEKVLAKVAKSQSAP